MISTLCKTALTVGTCFFLSHALVRNADSQLEALQRLRVIGLTGFGLGGASLVVWTVTGSKPKTQQQLPIQQQTE